MHASRTSCSRSLIAFCLAAGAAASAAADPAVIRVDASAPAGGDGASWATAFDDLSAAIDAGAALGGPVEFWIAAGEYVPGAGSADRTSTFELFHGANLYGGFAGVESSIDERDPAENPTVLSGDLGTPGVASDNAHHVLTSKDIFSEVVLDGLTIRGGRADGAGPDQDAGGGLLLQFSTAQIRTCTFEDNAASSSGGAVHAGTLTEVFVEACRFIGNSAETGGALNLTDGGEITSSVFDANSAAFGGGLATCCADVLLSDVVFRSNFGNFGGGVFCASGGLIARRSEFFNNTSARGAGAYLAGGGDKHLVNCRFGGGASSEGGGVWNSASLEMTNCQVVRNTAFSFGGGVFCTTGAELIMANSTIFANESLFGGAGVYLADGSAEIWNSILRDNTDADGQQESSQARASSLAQLVMSYCDIEAWEGAGDGNFDADPDFVDPYGEDGLLGTVDDDFSLNLGSACIDAGVAGALPGDVADLDADGDLAEPAPLDLHMGQRVQDDPDAPNAEAPGGGVDVGAVETPVEGGCAGDVDGDGIVTSRDLNLVLLGIANGDAGPGLAADVDGDGDIDTSDINTLLSEFGQAC